MLKLFVQFIADIAFSKIQTDEFKNFLQTYCGKNVPNASVLRKKYTDKVFTDCMDDARKCIGNRMKQ